jgi:hypothetical protein
VGSGAMNVGRRPRRESMIVGQAGCSIASRASNECKPQQLPAYRKFSGDYACSLKLGKWAGSHENSYGFSSNGVSTRSAWAINLTMLRERLRVP